MKAPSRIMPAARGKLTSSVTPSAVPARIIGTRRVHSLFTAFFGFSSPTLKAQHRSTTAKSASANLSGTKCVASGMVTSAEPNPVRPKINAPMKAITAKTLSLIGNQQFRGGGSIHGAQARDVAGEQKPIARLELFCARAQRAPGDAWGRAAKGKDEDVGVV